MNDLFAGVRSLETAMDYHLDRQVLLNANVANVNTPGYRPVDLGLVPPPRPEPGPEGPILLTRTSAGHLDPQQHPTLFVPFGDPIATPGNDLNSVDLDRELAKVAANTLRYETATELVARRLGALRYAASDGSGAG